MLSGGLGKPRVSIMAFSPAAVGDSYQILNTYLYQRKSRNKRRVKTTSKRNPPKGKVRNAAKNPGVF